MNDFAEADNGEMPRPPIAIFRAGVPTKSRSESTGSSAGDSGHDEVAQLPVVRVGAAAGAVRPHPFPRRSDGRAVPTVRRA